MVRLPALILFVLFFIPASKAYVYEIYVKQLEAKGLPYFYNDEIEKSIDNWVKNTDGATSDIIEKSNYYFGDIMRIQNAAGLPWFCKYIAPANSGLDVNFKESGGNTGIWLLPYNIAKKYSLVQNYYLDERKSLEKSTEAASQYLNDLHFIYKDWLLTITAFKIGPLKLNQTIRKAGNSLNFAEVYDKLEDEGKLAVAQFYGAIVSMHLAKQFGLPDYTAKATLQETVTTEVNLPYSLINQFTGIEIKDLENLNPEFREDIVPYFGHTAEFKINKDKKEIYNRYRDTMIFIVRESVKPRFVIDTIVTVIDSVENYEFSKREVEKNSTETGRRIVKLYNTNNTAAGESYVWVYYNVKAGDGFYTLSDVFDCTIPQLKQWNGIYNNTLIAGTTLKFYVKEKMRNYYNQVNYMTMQQKRNLALKD